MKEFVAIVVGIVVVLVIVISSMSNKGDLKRLQDLKNKRRFGGKRLPIEEQQELDNLAKRYWWY
jgi:hypothetical protein